MSLRSRCGVLLAIVDTEERVALVVTLEAHGYLVETTSTADEAQQRLVRSLPAVLISDIHLGELNGLQLGMVAAQLPNTATILLDREFDELRQTQATHDRGLYLVKPVNHEELIRSIEKLTTGPAE